MLTPLVLVEIHVHSFMLVEILNCSTDANPAAYMYQFYFNDAIIVNRSSGLLNITVDADGVYTCVPINTVGTGHNATVSITMVGKSLMFIGVSVFMVCTNFVNFYVMHLLYIR